MPIKGAFTPYDIERFKKAIAYLERHYSDSCSGEKLAVEIGIDIKLLRIGILILTGSTIHNYLISIRLKRATEDLADFKNSIKYIALQHGFSSSSHFIRLFKKHTGQTPNEFRLQLMIL